MLRLAGAEIRVPRFKRIGPKDAQTPDDLLCPQQGARAARGDQIPVRDRRGVHKIRLSLVAGAEHLQETGAVARVRPIVKQARTRQCGRRSADRAYRAPSGEQRGRFPDHGAVLRIVPGVPARQQQERFAVAANAQIQQALSTYIPDTTKIIIAQRISSVQNADRIIVLDDGRIDAVGCHDELLRTCEIYREVYESQQKGGEDDA